MTHQHIYTKSLEAWHLPTALRDLADAVEQKGTTRAIPEIDCRVIDEGSFNELGEFEGNEKVVILFALMPEEAPVVA